MINGRRDPAIAVMTATAHGSRCDMVRFLAGGAAAVVAATAVIARRGVIKVCR